MGSITSIKCVLTQEHLDAICAKYFVPEEVHPQLPSSDATMHERPTGKVGMYTRFFDYANYRIPFSNFFVSVLTHFRIPFSQLSVFGSAKVSHFEILCRVCNINPSVGLFRYFYMHNYKNGWFGFTKRPNVRACYSKNLDSVKNWNDHFFWVDEFVVPANARFGWFSGTNIVKDRAPTISEYNVEHANTLIAQASPFLRIVERERTENERPIVTVAKHRTVTLLPTSVPRPSRDLSASIEREFVEDAGGSGGGDQEVASVSDHGKKRVTRGSESAPAASHPPKRLRANYGTTGGFAVGASPLEEGGDHTDSVTGPSLRTVGPSARFVVLSDSSHHSGAKSADPEVDYFVSPVMTTATTVTAFVSNAATTTATPIDSVGGYGNVEPIMPTTDNIVAETEASGPKRSKKKRVTRESESTPAASHPPKRLRADYGTTGGSAAGGKSPSVLNRLLQDSRLMVEQGVPALPTLPFITSSVTASPLEEGGDHTDSVTGPSLRTVGPSARFVVLSDSSHHSGAKSADPEVDSFVRSVAPVMTAATTVTAFVSNAATTTATPVDVGKDKDVPTPSVFAGSSSSDKTDRTLSLFTGRSGSDFVAGSIRAGGAADVDLQEIYIPEWSVTKGFELNDGRSCANMIDHFTPPAFFKTVRGMEHEQLFAEFNVSAARNLSLSSEVRMRAEYNILEKRKWKSLAVEKNNLLQVKDKEIKELRSQLLQAKDVFIEMAQLCTRVSSLEAIKGLESIIAENDRELSDLGTSSSSLRSQNQSLVNHVHKLETSSAGLREKLETYEGSMKQLEELQDNLMKHLEARLAKIDADFTRCCMHFQENFHPHLINAIAGWRWLLTHGMNLLMAKCLNSTEYMEALGNAFGRAIEKGMQEGLAAGIEHGQAGRCLSDLEAYNPSAEADFNSTVRDLHGLDFPLLRELSAKKDASTWDVMDLLRLDDATVRDLRGMTDLQPDVGQLMVPVHHKQDKVVIGSQALSVALETCHRRVQARWKWNLTERLPFLKDVFVSIDHPLSAESLTILPATSTEPPVMALITTALSTVVIHPNSDPFLLVEDYENPNLAGAVPEDVIPGPKGEGKVGGSTEGDVDVGDLVLSQLENEARDVVL
ncbi:hypothetical protein Tco_1145631 [Tanacetum coccineum]